MPDLYLPNSKQDYLITLKGLSRNRLLYDLKPKPLLFSYGSYLLPGHFGVDDRLYSLT